MISVLLNGGTKCGMAWQILAKRSRQFVKGGTIGVLLVS